MKAAKFLTGNFKEEKGAVAVKVAIMMTLLIGIVALAVDIGYMMVVRNQLQNAADAAALAGCNRFYARNPGSVSLTTAPNWNAAETEATNTVKINKADNKALVDALIETGWWDYAQSKDNPCGGMVCMGTTPPLYLPDAVYEYGPAISVKIKKETGQNSGPIATFFAGIFGIANYDREAEATAVAASPGSIRPGALAPVAISKALVENKNYQDHDSPEERFNIMSPYDPALNPDYLAGQWTSLNLDTNNVTDVRGLIEEGNSIPLTVGQDNIWIQPGVQDTLYYMKNEAHAALHNNYAGHDIFLPVVDANITDSTHSSQPLAGFIGFHLLCAGAGCDDTPWDPNPAKKNEKVIVGYFTTAPQLGISYGPIGNFYGPPDKCRLCK